MSDPSLAIIVSEARAVSLANSVTFAAGKPVTVYPHMVQSEMKGYTLFTKGSFMTNDDLIPYVGA